MNAKLSLALIALVGIGVFALPSTMALFAGQHSFYNIDATGNQVPCQKCHGDVKAELSSGYSTTTGTKGPHANFKCEYCHRAEAGFASGDDAVALIKYSDGSASRYLVTTIQNFERGNFPKNITGDVADVDTWSFADVPDYRDVNGRYAGRLSAANGTAQLNYSFSSEKPTYNSATGQPYDTNLATKGNAVDPRLIVVSVSGGLTFDGAGSREVVAGTRYHAASLVSCLECHGGEQNKGIPGYEIETSEPYNHAGWLLDASDPTSKCSNCHYGPAPGSPAFEKSLAAGGFGLTGFANDTGEVEAHKPFVKTNDTMNRFGYGASNGACIACHTHVAVDINFKKGYKLAFDATNDKGSYSVGNFAIEGQVNISIYGNGSAETFATSNMTYNWAPGQTMYINGNKSQVMGQLNNEADDSQAALTSP